MKKSRFLLSGGREITSGEGQTAAIQSVTHTATVNAGEELTCGSVCAAQVRGAVLDPEGVLPIAAGEEFTYYRGDTPVGRFIAEKPERRGNLWQITAYDRVTLLDKDLTDWLAGLDGWPYDALTFARMVAQQCGLTLKNTALLNGTYPVEQFAAWGITGRRLMEWLGQLSGSFCRATPEGELEFAWYEDRFCINVAPAAFEQAGSGYSVTFSQGDLALESPALTVQGGGDVTVTGLAVVSDNGAGDLVLEIDDGRRTGIPYAMGSLTLADYETAPINGVRLRLTEDDVGVTYPAEASGNLYVITGNPMLTGKASEAAKTLYERLRHVRYTPGSVTVPGTCGLKAGDRVTVRDTAGHEAAVYLMESERRGSSVTFQSTGSRCRQSPAAANEESYKAVNGRFFEVRKSMDGLKLKAQEADAHIAQLEMDTRGLTSTVSSVRQQVAQNQSAVNWQLETVNNKLDGVGDETAQNAQGLQQMKTDITTLRQSAEGVSIRVQRILESGVSRVETAMGYSFDDEGLKIQKPGDQMCNTLDDTGMEVTRSGEVMLRADKDGVLATDVTVRNYLIVGEHARFENYSDGTDPSRTACFFI